MTCGWLSSDDRSTDRVRQWWLNQQDAEIDGRRIVREKRTSRKHVEFARRCDAVGAIIDTKALTLWGW